jgi:aminomethyltransferase
MVPFAGYAMPVQYPPGIIAEHHHTRSKAGLFDVSHMGQGLLVADDGRHETVARALETLVPADILGLALGRLRYTQLLNAEGGTIDDLMVTRPASAQDAGRLALVVNASRKETDWAVLSARLPAGVRVVPLPDRALLALQGPQAAQIMAKLAPAAAAFAFMQAGPVRIGDFDCHVSRSGYTGEDGFEIAVEAGEAAALARLLLARDGVAPVGLGARDSLRLEAGLCLYGHELDETTSPVEAALAWSVPKRRREEGGFPGAGRIGRELRAGPARLRVGIRPEGRAPAREGTEILSAAGERIGTVTSGGFAPTLGAPIAMGYVAAGHAAPDTPLSLVVRGRPLPARVVALPFVPHRYVRKG